MTPLRYYFLSLLSLSVLVSCSPAENIEVYDGKTGINIRYRGVDRLMGLKVSGAASEEGKVISPIQTKIAGDFLAIQMTAKGAAIEGPDAFYGSFFDSIPDFQHGVTLWRYKPWNAWTRPILIRQPGEMQDWDVQFFYWQYEDGLYGSAMPLSGHGYRTTLGQSNGRFGAKSLSYGPPELNQDTIPQMLIGFGNDPYALFKQLFEAGLTEMGKPENAIGKKIYPGKMDYIGWCTWNASENGRLLTEDFVIESVKTFTDHDFPLGWVIIDDGWFDHEGRKLNSFRPDTVKFPNGFTSLNKRLREECGLKEVGIWHTLNGYWNGINVRSELGKHYQDELFSWQTKPWSQDVRNKSKTYHFIKPESRELLNFYREMHRNFKDQGFSFLKVDNQLVPEQMAPKNYPVFTLSEKMHEALYKSADEYFDGVVINCMDMTADAYLNFGSSAIARAVEDYFPVEDNGVGYQLPYGNAAVHLVMAFYNSIYFQQMVYPDLDMFESHNPDGDFHAVARAINNGPVYVTDKPGEQNFDLLNRLCYSDGRLIRPERALTPTVDCLFQIQAAKAFKAFSTIGSTGLLGVWNVADADVVYGQISADDIHGLAGDDFIIYEYFSKKQWKVKRSDLLDVKLSRMEVKLFFIMPVQSDAAALGLLDKYNAPGTVRDVKISEGRMQATLKDHGTYGAIIPTSPQWVKVDGQLRQSTYENKLLLVNIAQDATRREHTVEIKW
ncbi:MAG: Sip1-related alpha-galactosidase [Bacteroidota bacterium]